MTTNNVTFSFDASSGFLAVDNLPDDFRTNQDVLQAIADEKNSHGKACKGFQADGEALTVVHRGGAWIVRGARGYGSAPSATVAKKQSPVSFVDNFLNNRPAMIEALQAESEKLSNRLEEVTSLLTALTSK